MIAKNARGHAFFEYGEPMLDDPAEVSCWPLLALTAVERAEFEARAIGGFAGWPEVGSRMLTRLVTGQDLDGSWVVVQEGVYRYAVVQAGSGLLVRAVIAEYLGAQVRWGDD